MPNEPDDRATAGKCPARPLAETLAITAAEIAARLDALGRIASAIRRGTAPMRGPAPPPATRARIAEDLRSALRTAPPGGRDAALLALDTLLDAAGPDPALAAEIEARLVAMRKARQGIAAATQAADQMAQRIAHVETALALAADAGDQAARAALSVVAARLVGGLAEDLEAERTAIVSALDSVAEGHAAVVAAMVPVALPAPLDALPAETTTPIATSLAPARRVLEATLADPAAFDAVGPAAADGHATVAAPLAESVATLEALACRLAADAADAPGEPAAAPVQAALDRLSDTYTMDRERQLHDQAVARLAGPAASEDASRTATPPADGSRTPPRWRLFADRLAADPRTGFVVALLAGTAAACALLADATGGTGAAIVLALMLQGGAALVAGLHLHRLGEIRLARQRADTERLVFRDALTGTLNRRGMMRLLDGLLATGPGPTSGHGSSQARAVAALHVDLDHFKSVNDTLGHEAGDQVLRIASARMAEAVGPDGAVCRVGGDEFCTVLVDRAAEEAAATGIAGRIVETARAPIETRGGTAQIGASIGIALWRAGQPASPGRLLADADLATYVSKSEGRGRWSLFDDALRAEAEAEARVARALARALAEEDGTAIRVWLQPVIDARDGSIVAAEALMRWFDPDLGEIAPETALLAAERNNLLEAVEARVLDRVLAAAAMLEARGLAPGRITLNLDRTSLRRHGLAEAIGRAAATHGVDPARLGVEVSEAACGGRGADLAGAALDALRGMGVGVVIDRLGRDQVSLAGLSAIRAGGAKLDRGLVGQIGQDGDGRSLLHGLVTLSRSLDLAITASGVETREQLAVLRELGVDAMQGYAIARPMAPEAFAEWVDFDQTLARTG